MKEAKLFLSGMIALIICFGIISAEGAEQDAIKTLPVPDLVIASMSFVPVPKVGSDIGTLKINVTNQGNADAAKCVLGLSCMVVKCDEGNKCDEVSRAISAEILVPPLRSGERTEIDWKPASPAQWIGGKYSVAACIDKYSVVQEANEANNICKSFVYIESISPRPSPGKK